MSDETWTRDDSWLRSKGTLPTGQWVPLEEDKWPRFCAEVPPELAVALDKAQRKSLGASYPTNATRANMVRAGLRLYLNAVDPEPDVEPVIEGTAEEIVELPCLGGI